MAEGENSRVISIECVAAGRYVPLRVVLSDVPAGFPSPADDYIEKNIDLNEWMIDNEIATYIVRVSGNSMKTWRPSSKALTGRHAGRWPVTR